MTFRRSLTRSRKLDEKRAERLKAALRENLRRRKAAVGSSKRDVPVAAEGEGAAPPSGSKRERS